jgi:L-ribulose-5-phosphate 4-epimerase
MNEQKIKALREELLAVAAACYQGRLQTGDGGNLSARIPGLELMIIKASGTAFSAMRPENLVLADFDGRPVEAGSAGPSRESQLHGALYRVRSELGAVLHCHSPWATGWASTGRELPEATYHSVLKLGRPVPVFDTDEYAVRPEFFSAITKILIDNASLSAFLLKRHGQVALGRTSAEALHQAELVEETAHIACLGALFNDR